MAGVPTGGFSLKSPVPLPSLQVRVLLLVSFAWLIAGYDINLLGLVLKSVGQEFGVAQGREAEIVMWARFGVLLAFPLAMLADRFGRRTILLITICGSAITTLLTAFAQNEFQFVTLQASVRMFGYAQDMVSIVVIAEEIDDRARGWALGLLAASAAVGGGMSAIIFAGIDILPYGWRALYVIGAVPIFVIAWFWRTMPETRRFKEMQAQKKLVAQPSGLKVALHKLHLLTVVNGRRFFSMLAVTAPLAIGVTCATVLFPTFLQSDVKLDPAIVTAIYVGGGLFGLFGNFIAGRLSDKHGRKPVFAVAGIAFITAMLGLYLGPHDQLWLIAVLWGVSIFAFFALEVVMGAWSAELFPTELRSTASGSRLAVNIIAGGAALLAQTFLYDELGGHALSIAVLLPALVIAVIVAWITIPETSGKTLEEIQAEGARRG